MLSIQATTAKLRCLALFLAVLVTPVLAQSSSDLPQPFVYLSEIAPEIQQDMRYASTNNFLGRHVEGYLAAECILTDKTAHALKRVQAALPKGFSLRVYDCYRPEIAVSDFGRWSQQESDAKTKEQYYPDLDRRNLFKLGYIAARSMHSHGNTVDLTIVQRGVSIPPFKEQYRQIRCDAPVAKRPHDNSLDFGTGFDCFDPKSSTWSDQISDEGQRNRRFLVDVMKKEGFQNYSKEWWHFELKEAATPVPHNFPIRKRPDQPKKDTGTPTALVAPEPDTGKIASIEMPREEARKRLEADKSRLEGDKRPLEKREKELQASKDKADQEMKGITARLVETGKLIQASEARLSVIESKQGELEKQEKQLRDSLERRHGTLSALLAALQRMGRNPPPVMVTRREDALTMVRSAMLLAPAIPKLHGQAAELKEELGQLSRVMQSSRAESERLTAEKGRHDEVRIKLAALQEAKRKTGAQYQAELQNVRQEVARIAGSVKEVSDLLSKLDKELQNRTPSAGSPKEVAAVLAPSGQKLALLTPGRIKPQIPFAQARGMLQLPIQGPRVISFGQKTGHGSLSKNIGIQTRFGGTVVSPCDGEVAYAGEFRTYGQVLIISPGDGYHVLMAGLSQIDVQVGQSVLMGEPVGVMSSAMTTQAAQDSRGPVLYIEFRKDRQPINPDPWWSEASRKGQG